MSQEKIEVEYKYPIPRASQLGGRLVMLGVRLSEPVDQEDIYFAHPARDYRVSDEALRLRRVAGRAYLTYKGPRLDTRSKTREELELPLATAEDVARYTLLLERLGFRAVATVRKTRRSGICHWHGQAVAVAWDDVAGLGSFLELELVCAPDRLQVAQRCLESLGSELELGPSERRSYVELLLPSFSCPEPNRDEPP